MRKSRVVKKKTSEGDIHFIIAPSLFDIDVGTSVNFDEYKMRRITRKEASKPLLLLRTE